MRVVRGASEAEVVAAFLRAELDSPRWREQLVTLMREDHLDEAVVTRPDLTDAGENALRENLLERHRRWLSREGLFDGLPSRIAWSRVGLTPEEVLAIDYINWDWWLHLSGGTRRPLDAAKRIRAGLVANVTADTFAPIAARLRSARPSPELIAVARPDLSRLVAVEGHVRLTAYALFPACLPAELAIFVGIAEDITTWSQY